MILILVILCFLAVGFFTPLKDILSKSKIESVKEWIQGKGVLAPLFFIVLYIVSTVFLIPGSILTLLGGLIFGVTMGTLWVLVGANIGALLAFLIARYVARESIQRWILKKAMKIEEKIQAGGFYIVFWLRLIPALPFNILNYALGLTSVTLKDYVLASLLGMIPGTFVYVSLGNAASHISLSEPKVWTKPEIWGPFLLVILLSFLPKIFKKKQRELQKLSNKQ